MTQYGDSTNPDMSKRSHKTYPMCKMWKVIDLKKGHSEVAKIYGKDGSQHEIKIKEIHDSFTLTLQSCKHHNHTA